MKKIRTTYKKGLDFFREVLYNTTIENRRTIAAGRKERSPMGLARHPAAGAARYDGIPLLRGISA